MDTALENGPDSDESRLWKTVKLNPADDAAWVSLITLVEHEVCFHLWLGHFFINQNNPDKIRQVYNAFLAEFPLCYGYWNKYAEYERLLTASVNTARSIYERALQLFPHSVDLWAHYCTLIAEHSEDLNEIRRYDICILLAYQTACLNVAPPSLVTI